MFIAEERLQGINILAEVFVQETNDFWGVGPRKSLGEFPRDSRIGRFVDEFPHATSDVVAPEIENAESECRRLARNLRGKPSPPHGQLHLPGFMAGVILTFRRVAINARSLRIRLEHRTDGVVCSKFGQVDDCRFHELLINEGAVAIFRDVALSLRQFFQKRSLDRFLEEFVSEMDRAACILDHLRGLDT